MKYLYGAIFEPRPKGGYLVRVPDVPGCVTSGRDAAEALFMARDALAMMMVVAEEHGDPIQSASDPAGFKLEEGEFTALIDADTELYRVESEVPGAN